MSDSSPNAIPLWLLEAASHLSKLVPPEALSHFLNAQREVVLGITALIEQGNPSASSASRRRRAPTTQVRSRRPRRVIVD